MKKVQIFFLVVVATIFSCKKTEPAQVPADVYISGYLTYDPDSAIYIQAVYWKNNQLVMLQNNSRNSAATDIYVSGNDVYVSGYISYGRTSAPVYWKNGILNLLPLIVVNNIVYVAGTEYYGGQEVMKIWQNGTGTNITSLENKAFPNDMDISNGNVYVVGYEKQADTALNVFENNWKNNIVQTRIGNSTSVLNGIKVIGTDIYTVGTFNNTTVCRINGTAQTYFINATMKDIVVDK